MDNQTNKYDAAYWRKKKEEQQKNRPAFTFKIKKRPAKRKRQFRVEIHTTQAEKEMMQENAKETGFGTLSDYVRHIAIFGNVLQLDTSHLEKLKTEIDHIGNNINQIARSLNEATKIYRENGEMRDISTEINGIRNVYIQMLNFVKKEMATTKKLQDYVKLG